jgi:hypothetical protein
MIGFCLALIALTAAWCITLVIGIAAVGDVFKKDGAFPVCIGMFSCCLIIAILLGASLQYCKTNNIQPADFRSVFPKQTNTVSVLNIEKR